MSVIPPEEKPFGTREAALRQTILKAAVALAVATASLLLFMAMPLFPREVMVFVAIGLGALAFKAATPAVVLMVLVALPGYFYQLGSVLPPGVGLPAPFIGAMAALLLLVATLAAELGGAIGVAVGATAAVLMLTPLGLLAVPVMAATVLFRTRHPHVRILSAIFTFVILYYPLLAATATGASGGPPLLQPVSFHAAPPVSVVGLHELSAKVGQTVNVTSNGEALPYLRSLADYWPLSLDQRLLPVGGLFALLAAAAVAVVAATLALCRWLAKREVAGARFAWVAPIPALLAGVLAFSYLAGLLAGPLDYVVPASPFLMAVGGLLVGACGSAAELWLKRRDIALRLREQLADKGVALRSETELLSNRMEETKGLCRRMDTSGEDALRQICEQELRFTDQAVADMSRGDLEKKVALFESLQGKLHAAVLDSTARLYQYYDEDRQRYNDALTLAKAYGFSLGDSVQGPNFSALTSLGYGEVLKLQAALNSCYEASARSLAEGVEALQDRLTDVDPEFKRIGIDIARDYVARQRYAEALEEFLRELSDIEHLLGRTVAGLDSEIDSVSSRLETTVTDVLMPTAASLGDAAAVDYYRGAVRQIHGLAVRLAGNARLPDLMCVVASVVDLGEVLATICSRIGDRTNSLETSIREKAPRGYRWALDSDASSRVIELAQAMRQPHGTMSIRDRMSLIETGPSIVDSGAHSVKAYSIAHELLVNYANIEYLVEEALRGKGAINAVDLPVVRKYANEYLEIYRLKHPDDVSIDRDLGMLSLLTPAALK